MRYKELLNEALVTLGDKQIPITLSRSSVAIGEKIVNVNVAKLDAAWSKDVDFYVGPNGQGGIKSRYPNFGEWLQTADSMEASEVYVRDNGEIAFTNGRHRFAWLRDHGVTVMPVAMHPDAIANAKKFGYLA